MVLIHLCYSITIRDKVKYMHSMSAVKRKSGEGWRQVARDERVPNMLKG